MLIFLLLAYGRVLGQTMVQGRVTDPQGSPLPGVNVLVKGGLRGTATDSLGNFSIQASIGDLLVLTATGFQDREIKAMALPLTTVLYPDIMGMDEVVVTGAPERNSKKEYGNAISVIRARDLEHTATSSVSAMMNGRIMGAYITQNSGDPSGGFSVQMRGVGSVFSSSEPLYIVDGQVIDNSSPAVLNLTSNNRSTTNRLADISPWDIERIEAIPGPSAAAIYGSRASNGVIQIFTKRGRKGKPRVSFFTSINHNSLRKKLEMNDYPFRFGVNPSPGLYGAGDVSTLISNNRTNNIPPALGPLANNNRRLDTYKYFVPRYDYQDLLFRESLGTDNHLSFSGGSESSTYFFSASYLKNDGILKGTSFSRYSFRFSADHNLGKWSKVSIGASYNNSSTEEMPSIGDFTTPLSGLNFTDNVWDITARGPDGELLPVQRGRINPMMMIEKYRLNSVTDRLTGNINMETRPVKGLVLRGLMGLDTYTIEGNTTMGRLPYPEFIPPSMYPDGYASFARNKYRQWSSELTASYEKRLSDQWRSTTIAGYAGQFISTDSYSQEGRDLVPGLSGITAALQLQLPVSQKSDLWVYGYFLQQNFSYAKQLFLSVAARLDGSSAFGPEAGTIVYPKASISYLLHETALWKKLPLSSWITGLRLRGAYGKAGNVTGLRPFDRFDNYSIVNYTGSGLVLNRFGNKNIRPEVKTEWELGADVQLWQSRLGIQFSVFRQVVDGMILPFRLAPSNGAPQIVDNLGSMSNKGIEMKLDARLVDSKKFQWDLGLLFNRYRNEVLSLFRNSSFIELNATQGAMVGMPMNIYFGSYFARNEDGSLLLRLNQGFLLPQVELGDVASGKPLRDSLGQPVGSPLSKVLGDPNPDYQLTLQSGLRFGKWNIQFMIDRVWGFQKYNSGWILRNNNGNGPLAELELRGELERGYVAAIGNFIGPPNREAFVQDASFTKLRELSVSRRVKLGKAGDAEFSLAGRNLFSIDDYQGFDPETNSAGQGNIKGADFGSYPIPRVVQLSARFNF